MQYPEYWPSRYTTSTSASQLNLSLLLHLQTSPTASRRYNLHLLAPQYGSLCELVSIGTRDPHSIRRPPSRIATKDRELDSAWPTTRNRQPLLESSSCSPYQSRISIHSLEALRAAAPSASGPRQIHEWAQMREGIH